MQERILVLGRPTEDARRTLNSIRAVAYAFKGGSIIVELLILLIVAAPIVGAVTPQVSPQNEWGLGLDLQALNPQLQQVFSSASTIPGPHHVTVPAFNNWFLPGSMALTIALTVNGSTVYQTQKSTVSLAPFQRGALNFTVDIPPNVITEMQGQRVGGGGQMTIQEDGFWSITVDLSQG